MTKIKYYHEKCNAYKSNIKKCWKLINEFTGKISDKTHCVESLKIYSVEYYMPKDISNYLGDYFANVGKPYAQKIVPSSTYINEYLSKIDQNINSFYALPIDRGEIKKLVLALPNKVSSNHDNISNILLKKLYLCLLSPLEYIFNLSIQTGVFPDKMKLAEIIQLYKSKEKNLITNYRPISLLTNILKLLEKAMYKRTY